jgi:hypothetical protein
MTPAQRAILEDVATRHDLTVADLISDARPNRIAHPRQEAMYLMVAAQRWSTPQIGRVLGGRDHTTVLTGVRRHAERSGAPVIHSIYSQFKPRCENGNFPQEQAPIHSPAEQINAIISA